MVGALIRNQKKEYILIQEDLKGMGVSIIFYFFKISCSFLTFPSTILAW